MEIDRIVVNVCSNDLDKSKTFYQSLFSFDVNFHSDWFIHLTSLGGKFELGIVLNNHEVVPDSVKSGSNAMYLTFVVENVDEAFTQAVGLGYIVLESPKNMPYGQRRMLLLAPEGTTCDVSSPTPK